MSSLQCLLTDGFIEVMMLSVFVVEDEATWLLQMQYENLDLKKPKKIKKIIYELKTNPGIFLKNKNGIIGYANMQRFGNIIELNTVVIDPKFRGEGHSHKLIYSIWERWKQDPILHGDSFNRELKLPKFQKNTACEFLPCKLIAFTRNSSLASTFISAGFKMAIPKRKWWSLWLIKSQLNQLRFSQLLYLFFNRIILFVRMLNGEEVPKNNENGVIKRFFQKRRRLFHQLSHMSEYKLFILSTDMQVKEWSRKGGPDDDINHPLKNINITTFSKGKESNPKEITKWDSGEKEKIPYVDLSE